MKKLLSLFAAVFAVLCCQAEGLELTDKIANPGFEEGSLAGWNAGGFQVQKNESPADVGWEKEGTYYAEKWVAAPSGCGAVDLCQTVQGLEPGDYRVVVIGHAINQKDSADCTGCYVYAGTGRTPVVRYGEFEVTGTVAEGFLKIGFATDAECTANWVAVDNFRLYSAGESLENYKKYLQSVLDELDYIINDPDRPAVYNKEELEAALAAALAATTKEQILAAIPALRTACANYLGLKRGYSRLASYITMTEQLLADSDYPGKDALAAVLVSAKATYENKSASPAELSAAVDAIKAASQTYVAGRPGQWVTIKNGALWKDTDGNPVQAHGAGFLQVNDTWYMIGEDRTKRYNPDVNMYSTKDFVHWKFERKIIENKVTHPDLGQSRMIERPKLMLCDATGQFVVWCHWESSNYGASEAGVFYANKVNDPYTYHVGERPLGVKSRDCTVFVDDDATAYFISTTEENTNLGFFRLNDDYLSAAECTSLFKGQRREAPAIVKHEGKYYMLSSACSGWDPNQCKLSTSSSMTAGWSGLKNLGNTIAFDTQPAAILIIKGTKATTYLFVGDRWQDPSLPESKTIIFPISFTEDGGCVYEYREQFEINFVTGEWRAIEADPAHMGHEAWTILSASSQETAKEDGVAENAIDGDFSTKWHSQWSGTVPAPPHTIAVDMGQTYTLSSFRAAPRTDNSTSGIMREYALYVAADTTDWQLVSAGSWYPYWSEIYFRPTQARYFKLAVLSGYGVASELNVGNAAPDYENGSDSDLRLSYKVNSSSMEYSGTSIRIKEGDSITVTASHASLWGSWIIEGPDTVYAGSPACIGNITEAKAGTYKAHFLDQYNQSHTYEFSVAIRGGAGIATATADAEVVATEYYTASGMPSDGSAPGLYIVVERYSDGSIRTSKQLRR